MFSAAGTVYVDHAGTRPALGARITITDQSNKSVTMVANGVGNFFTTERLEFPIRARIEYEGMVREMLTPQPMGACNYCHRTPPRRGAPGRISATLPGGQGSSR